MKNETRSGPSSGLAEKQRSRGGVSSAAVAFRQLGPSRTHDDQPSALDTTGSAPLPTGAQGSQAPLLHAEDVAMILGVTKGWIYAEVRAGRIPCVRLGRYVRFRRESIEGWLCEIESGTMRSNSKAPGRGWHRPRHGTGGVISHAEQP
jgi:excisionase family DNA binding protein